MSCLPQEDQFAVKELGEEPGAPARNIDVLPDQIAVHPRHEVFKIEVDVFHRAVELGGVVVAQVFGVLDVVDIAARGDEGAARLAHLLAVDGEEAVREQFGRRAEAGVLQHGGPEQRVEIQDVLADEVVELGVGALFPVVVEVDAASLRTVA